jgi:hypothetical protein
MPFWQMSGVVVSGVAGDHSDPNQSLRPDRRSGFADDIGGTGRMAGKLWFCRKYRIIDQVGIPYFTRPIVYGVSFLSSYLLILSLVQTLPGCYSGVMVYAE